MKIRRFVSALTLALFFSLAPFVCSWAAPPEQNDSATVQAEAEKGGYRLIDVDALWQQYQVDYDKTLLVDTRQEWEYQAGYIKGAVNFPMEPTWLARMTQRGALEQFLGPDKTKTLVFYWAGLTWVRSDSAARVAVSLGYKNVYRYPQGYPEWQAKGLPTAKTDTSGINAPAAPPSAKAAKPPSGLTLLWTLVGVFVGGMALNLTPCVYPLIPITVSYFGGRSGTSHGELAAHGLCYLAGLAATNSTLGVMAAMTGGLMGAMLQNSWVLAGVAAVLLVFATSLFGFWELRLPSGLTQAASKSYAGYFGSLFMGLTLGIIAAPCIGPFVLGLLTWVASVGLPWFGFIIFFSLSLGLGLPLFILALFSGKLEKLPRSGEWMIWVRKLMGWVLVGMAAYFARPLLPKAISVFVYSAIALSAGVHLAWVDKSKAAFGAFKWIKNGVGLAGIAFALFFAGAWLLRGPGVVWQPYSTALLEQARQEGRPVIMDFYATWCAPCRELDEITFHDQKVVTKVKEFVLVKIDLTSGDNPVYQQLVKDYEVKGVPTVVFLGKDGNERRDLRLVEFMNPADFVLHMKKVL